MKGEWKSKVASERHGIHARYQLRAGRGSVQKAHFIRPGLSDADAPLCTTLRLKSGAPAFAPFVCAWGPLHPKDKKCGVCRQLLGEVDAPRRAPLKPTPQLSGPCATCGATEFRATCQLGLCQAIPDSRVKNPRGCRGGLHVKRRGASS